MKVKLEFFKCMGIMLANLCHPYIVRTTVLTDTPHKALVPSQRFCSESVSPEVYLTAMDVVSSSGTANFLWQWGEGGTSLIMYTCSIYSCSWNRSRNPPLTFFRWAEWEPGDCEFSSFVILVVWPHLLDRLHFDSLLSTGHILNLMVMHCVHSYIKCIHSWPAGLHIWERLCLTERGRGRRSAAVGTGAGILHSPSSGGLSENLVIMNSQVL